MLSDVSQMIGGETALQVRTSLYHSLGSSRPRNSTENMCPSVRRRQHPQGSRTRCRALRCDAGSPRQARCPASIQQRGKDHDGHELPCEGSARSRCLGSVLTIRLGRRAAPDVRLQSSPQSTRLPSVTESTIRFVLLVSRVIMRLIVTPRCSPVDALPCQTAR